MTKLEILSGDKLWQLTILSKCWHFALHTCKCTCECGVKKNSDSQLFFSLFYLIFVPLVLAMVWLMVMVKVDSAAKTILQKRCRWNLVCVESRIIGGMSILVSFFLFRCSLFAFWFFPFTICHGNKIFYDLTKPCQQNWIGIFMINYRIVNEFLLTNMHWFLAISQICLYCYIVL